MKQNIFPIVEVKDNEIIALDGNIGQFFEIIAPDLEQLSSLEKDSFYNQVSSSLNELDSKSYFKFYRLNEKNFLETNSRNFSGFESLKTNSSSNHLEYFFESMELYSDIKFFDDYIYMNGSYIKLLSVLNFKDDPIDESIIPIDIDYVLTIRRKDKEQSIKYLEKIRDSHQSSFLKRKKDISSEGAYDQAEELLSDITYGTEEIFEMSLFFLVKANSLSEVGKLTDDFQRFMGYKGIRLYLEGNSPLRGRSGIAQLFNELIPGVRPKLGIRNLPNKTSHLRYLLPLKRSHLMDSGIEFLDTNDAKIFLDPFNKSLKNRNMLVSGLSGAGKSVFVNKVVHHLISKHPTVIIDIGGSFKRLTLYHGGKDLKGGFNPLQFKDPIYLREFILSVVDKDSFSKLDRGRLLSEIKVYLDKKGQSNFDGLIGHLENSFSGIRYYFEDIKEYLIDESINNYPILYVDLENYPNSIVSPLIIFLLEYFKNISELEKILVIDECWEFLKEHSDFVSRCFRTFRKTGAFPIAIAQALEDFQVLGNKISKAITNSSYFQVFFPQEIESSGNITEFDCEKISSLDYQKNVYSDCYIKTSDEKYRKILRNKLSELELEISHSEPSKEDPLLSFVDKNHQFFETIKDAFHAFVGLKYAKDINSFNNDSSHIWN